MERSPSQVEKGAPIVLPAKPVSDRSRSGLRPVSRSRSPYKGETARPVGGRDEGRDHPRTVSLASASTVGALLATESMAFVAPSPAPTVFAACDVERLASF